MKHILSLLLVLFLIACQKEEPVETAEAPEEKAKTLCEKYAAHIRSPFVKTFQTKEICMDSVHLVLFRNPKWDSLATFYDSWIASPKLNLIEFATVTSPKTRRTDSLFALKLKSTLLDFSNLSMPRFGDTTDNIDLSFYSIPYSYYRYPRNDQFTIFKKSATELYIQHDFELDIYSTETGKLRPKINAFKKEEFLFHCHNPTPAFNSRVFYTDSSILIKASPKMHSNYLEYFFDGDSLHMALQPDYCLVMAFYRDNGEKQVYSNKNCTPEMLKDPRGLVWNINQERCSPLPFYLHSCIGALPAS